MLRTLPLISRTQRPSVVSDVWHTDGAAATSRDITINVPSGLIGAKLILLVGTNGGEFLASAVFNPGGGADERNFIQFASVNSQSSPIALQGFYLDGIPVQGNTTIRLTTTSSIFVVARAVLLQWAKAGSPSLSEEEAIFGSGTSIALPVRPVDAYSISFDLVVDDTNGLNDLTPSTSGQTRDQQSVVNGDLFVSSSLVHENNGNIDLRWSAAASAANIAQLGCNVSFTDGQVPTSQAVLLGSWDLNDPGTSFANSENGSPFVLVGGSILSNVTPALATGGNGGVSVQGSNLRATHEERWLTASWSARVYFQARSSPAAGNNRPLLGKDINLLPGGWQIEQYNDNGTDRIRFGIRDETGGTNSTTWVTGATGAGTISLNTGHVVHVTYDDAAKTARVYLDRALIAELTDSNLFGLQSNSTDLHLGSRPGTPGVEFDGILDECAFWSGVLTAAQIAADPAPVTISDPGAGGGITAVDDDAGDVDPSTTTDVDVLANDTGKTGPDYHINIVSDPNARLSVINQDSPTAQVRITTPAAPSVTVTESGTYNVQQGTAPTFGAVSNNANISWTRRGASFSFVEGWSVPVDHTGASKPAYNDQDPLATSFIDPMSGLRTVRLGGEPGQTVYRYDSAGNRINTGLVFPYRLRNPNTATAFKSINADGTLIMIAEYFNATADSSLGSICRAYIVDVTGQYSGGVPYRIIRASDQVNFGEANTPFYFWHSTDPFRVIVKRNDGRFDNWFPIGRNGENPAGPGIVEQLVPAPTGTYDSFTSPSYGRDHDNNLSRDGRWHVAGCRRVSDGLWGGIRVDLDAGAYVGPFMATPAAQQNTSRPTIRSTGSLTGTVSYHETPGSSGNSQTGLSFSSNQFYPATPSSYSHPAMIDINGREYIVGVRDNNLYTAVWDIELAVSRTLAPVPQANPTHVTPLLGDRFETYGANGSGASSGDRYVIQTRNTGGGGGQRSIIAIRTGPNDSGVVRFVAALRGTRTANYNEQHAQARFINATRGGLVVFSSNWDLVGGQEGVVNPYVVELPPGWASPNNDGS